MKNFTTTLFLLIALSCSLWAQDELHHKLQESLDEFISELNLEPAQEQETSQILRDAFQKQNALLASKGIQLGKRTPINLSRDDMRQLRDDMSEVKEQTERSLDSVLNSDQMERFKRLREAKAKELRAELMRRLQ